MELRVLHDIFGRWQWLLVNVDGKPVKESERLFNTAQECISGTRRNGCAELTPIIWPDLGHPLLSTLFDRRMARGN